MALVTFYRSYLTAADTGPVDALIAALREQGLRRLRRFRDLAEGAGVADWLARTVRRKPAAAIVNATAFSATGDDGDHAVRCGGLPGLPGRVVDRAHGGLGVLAAAACRRPILPCMWCCRRSTGACLPVSSASSRRASAMPICSSRIWRTSPIASASMRRCDRVCALASARDDPRARQARLPWCSRAIPAAPHQIAHAVGLDALASTEALLGDLGAAGFDVEPTVDGLGTTLGSARVDTGASRIIATALAKLPRCFAGESCKRLGRRRRTIRKFATAHSISPAIWRGKAIVAVQPERGEVATRDADYHDLSRIPRHAYVAFYLWLRTQGIHALVHMGAHGTLEWLPGKSVALSEDCWPEALIGDVPVIYPFIVNDPGEAAQAKRRIGAVTIGHLPPPLAATTLPPNLAAARAIARRIFHRRRSRPGAARSGSSRRSATRRARRASRTISVLPATAAPAEAIPRIDRFVCDLKESQFGDGLHVFGRGALRRRGAARAARGAVGPARRARPGGLAASRTQRRAADRAQSLCRRSPRRADPRRACAGHQARGGAAAPASAGSRRLAEGRWSSISGARRPCARRARNSPWRCSSPASRRAGMRRPAASLASRSSRSRCSAGRAST